MCEHSSLLTWHEGRFSRKDKACLSLPEVRGSKRDALPAAPARRKPLLWHGTWPRSRVAAGRHVRVEWLCIELRATTQSMSRVHPTSFVPSPTPQVPACRAPSCAPCRICRALACRLAHPLPWCWSPRVKHQRPAPRSHPPHPEGWGHPLEAQCPDLRSTAVKARRRQAQKRRHGQPRYHVVLQLLVACSPHQMCLMVLQNCHH